MGALSGLLFVAACVSFFLIYDQGSVADRNAQALLAKYDKVASKTPAAVQPATSASPNATPGAMPTGSGDTQQRSPAGSPMATPVSVGGYQVIGKLCIEKAGLVLPIIGNESEAALKVSVCRYGVVLPGEPGNLIITGHNYADGSHFGKLHTLKAGDVVALDAPDGKEYRYKVYETQVVRPDDVNALDKYEGECGLTLVTCTSSGNRRLIIRCKIDSNHS